MPKRSLELPNRLALAGVTRQSTRHSGRFVEVQQILQGVLFAFGERIERVTFHLRVPEDLQLVQAVVLGHEQLCTRLTEVLRAVSLGTSPLHQDWRFVGNIGDILSRLLRDYPFPDGMDFVPRVERFIRDRASAMSYLNRPGLDVNLILADEILSEAPHLAIPVYLKIYDWPLLLRLRNWLINGEETDPFTWPFNGVN